MRRVDEVHGARNHGAFVHRYPKRLAEADAGDDERERYTLGKDQFVNSGRYRLVEACAR